MVAGLKQAGNNWYRMLRDALLKEGFVQSTIDQCLLRHDCLLVGYVDDCLLFAREDATLDTVLARFRITFELTDEGDVGAYLGLDVNRNSAGQFELTQPGLISKIVSECGLQSESNEYKTPSLTTLLSSDCTGEQRHHTWSYRMLIGMLNYVASTSRPDIA